MREALDKIRRKIYINQIGEQTEWKEGYGYGLAEALAIVEDGIADLIVPKNNYFVVMYHDGNKYLPYIEEMRLYKIDEKNKKKLFFSRNLNATTLNTPVADLILSDRKSINNRVFFAYEDAENAISD